MPSSRDFVGDGQDWEPPDAELRNAWTRAAIAERQAAMALPRVRRIPASHQLRIDVLFAGRLDAGQVTGFGDPVRIVTDASGAQESIIFAQGGATKGRWAVAEQGALQNEVRPCVLTGVVWIEVDILSESHTHADATGATLQSATSGYAKILYKPSGVGLQWCCLYLGCCGGTASPNTVECDGLTFPESITAFFNSYTNQQFLTSGKITDFHFSDLNGQTAVFTDIESADIIGPTPGNYCTFAAQAGTQFTAESRNNVTDAIEASTTYELAGRTLYYDRDNQEWVAGLHFDNIGTETVELAGRCFMHLSPANDLVVSQPSGEVENPAIVGTHPSERATSSNTGGFDFTLEGTVAFGV